MGNLECLPKSSSELPVYFFFFINNLYPSVLKIVQRTTIQYKNIITKKTFNVTQVTQSIAGKLKLLDRIGAHENPHCWVSLPSLLSNSSKLRHSTVFPELSSPPMPAI